MRILPYLLFLVFTSLAAGSSSCDGKPANSRENQDTQVKIISAADLVRLQGEGARVIDVRTIGEVAEGKIPGAEHVQLSGDFVQDMKNYAKEEPIVLYCRSGGRSSQAASMLKEAGFTNLYNYSGGIVDWQASGNKTE